MKKKTKKKKGNPFFLFITLICLSIAGKLIYDKVVDYMKTKEKYDDLKEQVIDDNGEHRHIDWELFRGTDVIAWIECGEIDYPVVQGEDNSFYLHHSYDGAYTFSGSIFMNSYNSKMFQDNNTVIYGHNMKNGSMFGLLSRYMDEAYSTTKEFYIYRPDGTKHIYKMYAVAPTQYDSLFYTYSFNNMADYWDYQNQIKEASVVDFGVHANLDRKMVTLSTCASIGSAQGKRVVLVGMETQVIQVQEPASWWE